MSLTLLEQETIILFNEEEKYVTINTASPVTKRRCDKLGFEYEREPNIDKEGKEIAWWYKIPKTEFRWGKKHKRNFTPEQRKSLSERAKKLNPKKS